MPGSTRPWTVVKDRMSENRMAHRIRATRDAPSQARRMIGEMSSNIGRGIDDVALVLSELVTNSVVHGNGSGDIDFSLDVGNSIRVEVTDRGAGFDPSKRPRSSDGLGLVLVERLAQDWGVSRDGDQFTVWAVLPRG